MFAASSFVTGAALGLAALLLIASVLKARAPARFELALVQVLPRAIWRDRFLTSRTVAWSLITIELATGLALVLTPADQFVVVASFTAVLFASFFGATVAAFRKGAGCGCFGDTKSRASRASLVRSLWLLTVAAALVGGVTLGRPAPGHNFFGISTIVIGAAVILIAAAPNRVSRMLAARRHIRQVETETAVAAEPVGRPGMNRRSFLRTTLAAAGVAIGASYLRLPVAYANTYTCEGRFNLCWACCGGVWWMTCSECCGECYDLCKAGRNCPSLSCYTCWP